MFSSRHRQEFASSPISKLPIELLSEIFSVCLLSADENVPNSEDESEHSTPIITTETVRVPFVLSSVSKRWRAVALGQSSLWSNLCITAELIGETVPLHLNPDQTTLSFTSSQTLHTKQIVYCLQRSRQAPLNVFIDARDPEWNFVEAGVGEDPLEMFAPEALFSAKHMNAFISLLLPHLSRWKSLTILTDTWAPMHAALMAINPYITVFGAPRLESMTLMRCNEFVSYASHFQPSDLKDPLFLSRHDSDDSSVRPILLPRLKHLSLRGVHMDWDSLGDALSTSARLSSLELTCHSADVRPSISQFHRLLSSSPHLQSLTLSGSAPEVPDSVEDILRHPEADPEPVLLEHLQSLNIGYRTALEGRTILELVSAPNVKRLVLEDATYPGDPDEVNASSLLYYLGSKEFVGSAKLPVAAKEEDVRRDESKPPSTPRRRKSSVYPQHAELSSPRAAFPQLQTVIMKNVKSSSRSLRTLYNGLPNLQHLELVGMSISAIQALVPSTVLPASASPTCPCPRLRYLCIRDFEQPQAIDVNSIVTSRERCGACAIDEVDIHVDSAAKAACVATAASPRTKVNIISDDEDEEETEEMDVDPFEPGGAFNDPFFDQYYSDHITIR